jgi:hypothetical protein
MQQIGTYTPDNFFAGSYPIAKEATVVADGEEIIMHEPVKLTEDGTIAPVTLGTATEADETSGTPAQTADQNTVAGLYAIAAESGAAGDEIAVYLTGEYFAGSLVLQDGVTADVLKPEFRKLGIFLKNIN